MKHIAREGCCWVVGVGTALQGKDLPANFPERKRIVDDEDWLCDGDAVIAQPFGKIAAGPLSAKREFSMARLGAKPTCGRAAPSTSRVIIRGPISSSSKSTAPRSRRSI